MEYVSVWRVDVPRPLMVVLAYIAAMRVCDVANNAVMTPELNAPPWEPLHDIGHSLLPVLDHTDPASFFYGLPDWLFVVNLVGTVVVCSFHVQRHPPRGWRLLSDALTLHGGLLLLRATTILATKMPTPIPGCRGRSAEAGPVPSALSTVFCNDQMFSGHTVSNVICLHLVWAVPRFPQRWKLAWTGYVALVILASIATRDHYTVDCLVALYLTTALFWVVRKRIQRYFTGGDTMGPRRFV